MLANKNYEFLKKLAFSKGASLFGVADVTQIRKEFEIGRSVSERLTRAVSFGVGLSACVLSEIEDHPTKIYFHHYKTANMFLDQLSFLMARFIEEKGYLALPVPASQITDWEKQKAHLSHKKIGCLAGLGWIGRNNLLVTKKHGSQFRLSTILTDMPLLCDKPVQDNCGSCVACMNACPAKAIHKEPSEFDHIACYEKLKSFQRQNIVGQFVCGVCVKVCAKKVPLRKASKKTNP